MPILKFYGVDKEEVKKYSNKIKELSKAIEASEDAIFFICQSSKIFNVENIQQKIYIEVDWLSRSQQLREKLVEHVHENLQHLNKKIYIKFTDLNKNLYIEKQLKN